jgi:hypothetical protein
VVHPPAFRAEVVLHVDHHDGRSLQVERDALRLRVDGDRPGLRERLGHVYDRGIHHPAVSARRPERMQLGRLACAGLAGVR